MKKDQVVILEKRGAVLISGNDADHFLQNIVTNDIKKVSNENAWEVGLACGGEITIYLEQIN